MDLTVVDYLKCEQLAPNIVLTSSTHTSFSSVKEEARCKREKVHSVLELLNSTKPLQISGSQVFNT